MKPTKQEMAVLKTLRSMSKRQRELAQSYVVLNRVFLDIGDESAKEISKIAKELHPDALMIHPLYRSVFVIFPPTEESIGQLRAIMYHDPAWMGFETTKETLPKFKEDVVIQGQRSGPDILKNGEELQSERMWRASTRFLDWDYKQLYNAIETFVHAPTSKNLRTLKSVFKNMEREHQVISKRYEELWKRESESLSGES